MNDDGAVFRPKVFLKYLIGLSLPLAVFLIGNKVLAAIGPTLPVLISLALVLGGVLLISLPLYLTAAHEVIWGFTMRVKLDGGVMEITSKLFGYYDPGKMNYVNYLPAARLEIELKSITHFVYESTDYFRLPLPSGSIRLETGDKVVFLPDLNNAEELIVHISRYAGRECFNAAAKEILDRKIRPEGAGA